MSSQNISPQNLMTITKENLENKIHLGVLSKEKKNYSFVFLENWITKGRFRQENLRASKRKIRHVNLLRIIHATIISLLLCSLRLDSQCGRILAGNIFACQFQARAKATFWEGRCQIAQSQIKSIESEKIVAALLSLSPFMNSMHLNQGDLINATIQGVWKQWRLQK